MSFREALTAAELERGPALLRMFLEPYKDRA
jgi:hypothetical protein